MAFLVELSGEQPDLAAADAVGAAEALAGQARLVHRDAGLAVVEAPDLDAAAYAGRLGLAHTVSAYWFSAAATPRALVPRFSGFDLEGARFAVRGKRLHGLHPEFPVTDTERAIGHVLKDTGRVDLKDPELEVRFLVAEEAHVGGRLADVDRAGMDARAVKHRPFFSPVSLHPKFCRALLNLARVAPGDRVADPFAGTGGLALEAGLLGARVLASDLDARMVVGTQDTLTHYGVTDAVVDTRDVGDLPDLVAANGGPVDVVVSDPPYGRASTTNREEMGALYDRFLTAARDALKPDGRLAVVLPDARHVARVKDFFTVTAHHELRVHASMTRHFVVCSRGD